jgi:hypothetical protein
LIIALPVRSVLTRLHKVPCVSIGNGSNAELKRLETDNALLVVVFETIIGNVSLKIIATSTGNIIGRDKKKLDRYQ